MRCDFAVKRNYVVFYTIRGATIKRFILLDCITGTGIYYGLIIITSSVLIGVVGCVVCTEGIKRVICKQIHRRTGGKGSDNFKSLPICTKKKF